MARVDSAELSEWMAYYAIEPFGPHMNTYMLASGMSLYANANSGKKGRKYSPDDFIPKRRKKQDWREMKRLLQEAL